jgi:Lhr-like helicase
VESLALLRRFGIVSSNLVEFLQGKKEEEQLELIKRIINPKGVDFEACVFGSSSLRQVDKLSTRLQSSDLSNKEKVQFIRNHESDARNAQNILVRKLENSNGNIPSYLGFMIQISPHLAEHIRSQEEQYQKPENDQGITLLRMLEDAQSRLNQSKQKYIKLHMKKGKKFSVKAYVTKL